MTDSLQNPVILNLSGGLWRKHFCLFAQHRFDPPPPLFGCGWFNVLKVEGTQSTELLYSLVSNTRLFAWALPCAGVTCSPPQQERGPAHAAVANSDSRFNEVWVWSWKTSGCAPKHLGPGAGAALPSS